MSGLETLPFDALARVSVVESHELELPPCCPVSKNPRPGSTFTICYTPKQQVLEVGSLYAYIYSFRGGLKGADGQIVVRDMEGMIARIARDCAEALGVPVTVTAHLVLVPGQKMHLSVVGKPPDTLTGSTASHQF